MVEADQCTNEFFSQVGKEPRRIAAGPVRRVVP
jgi:hypothetical protein